MVDSFTHPYGSHQSYGIEYINGYLWFSTCGAFSSDVLLIRINPESYDYDIIYKPIDFNDQMWGITYDGEYIWIVDAGSNYIQAYDGISPEEDNDGDGLSNEEEDIYEINPNKADTDGDSLSDGVEIRLNLDPNNWDSDGDGIGDGLEFIANFGNNSSAQCLPNGYIRMTIQWTDNFIIITTNSTMVSASFDSEKEELSFQVKGPSETISACNVTIPKNLVNDLNKIRVKIDGKDITFNSTQSENMVQLSFVYSHSEHNLVIALNEELVSIIVGYPAIFLIVSILGISMILYKKVKKNF